MRATMKQQVKTIAISDPFIIREVERLRKESGESTPTKTATRLIIERIQTLNDRYAARSAPSVAGDGQSAVAAR